MYYLLTTGTPHRIKELFKGNGEPPVSLQKGGQTSVICLCLALTAQNLNFFLFKIKEALKKFKNQLQHLSRPRTMYQINASLIHLVRLSL